LRQPLPKPAAIGIVQAHRARDSRPAEILSNSCTRFSKWNCFAFAPPRRHPQISISN
jgi:hypothetical protein